MGGDGLKPGFFIVGAPRCGTTSLRYYLSRHPEICFSKPKEPHFFSRTSLNVDEADLQSQYIEPFFAHYDPRCHRLLGEGSVSYLYSHSALNNILKVNPEAKFIVSVRNPIDMIRSYHARLLYTLDETEKDFAKAWSLQACRAAGRSIPETCRDPRLLQYAEVGMLGRHVQGLFRIVKPKQRKVVVFDDLTNRPRRLYQEILRFLDLEYDGRVSFKKFRENSDYRSSLMQQALVRPPKSLLFLLAFLERATGVKRLKKSLRKGATQINSVPVARPELEDGMKKVLTDTFAEDVELLSRLLNRDFTHWMEFQQGAR